MHVLIRVGGRSLRRWHVRLVERIGRRPGFSAAIETAEAGAGDLPASAGLLFRLEALLNRLPPGGLSDAVGPADLAPHRGNAVPDLVLDLVGDRPVAVAAPVWTVTFDGAAGEAALLAALMAGRAPVAAIVAGGRIVASGRLGTENGGVMLLAFEDALARTVTLLLSALAGTGPVLPDPSTTTTAPGLSAPALGARAARTLARALVRRLYHLCFRAPHWRVGWRRLDGPDLVDLRAHPPAGWHDLPDDGHRFYADPFAVEHDGRTFLFVEDYGHAAGKAVISAVALSEEGPAGRPEPVLEEPHHLSYPFVFVREGQCWMIPESSGSRTVDLYRATAFPGGWVKEATLLSGVTASDATLLDRGGLWWMFATVRDEDGAAGPAEIRGAFSDALHLWSAPDFRGPWTPHPGNPVLVDIASARPAGHLVARGGALIRPVQDGRGGYGAALALARVTRLDREGFGQEVETVLTAGGTWAGTRLHTLNRSRSFEFIDGSGRAPRWRG